MQQSGFYHANTLVQELTSKFEEHLAIRDSQLLSVMQSTLGLLAALSSSYSENTPPLHAANSISSDAAQIEILKLLKELKANVKRGSQQRKRDAKPGSNLKTPHNAIKKHWYTNRYR